MIVVVNIDIPASWRRKSAIKLVVEIVSVRPCAIHSSPSDVIYFDVLARCKTRTFGVRVFSYRKEDGSRRVSALSVKETWNGEFPPLSRRSQRRDAAHTIAITKAVEGHVLTTLAEAA